MLGGELREGAEMVPTWENIVVSRWQQQTGRGLRQTGRGRGGPGEVGRIWETPPPGNLKAEMRLSHFLA